LKTVRTEAFFDASYWEAPCPDGWTFRRDMSVRGFPHVFEAERGYRLQIGWSRDVKLDFVGAFDCPWPEPEPMRIAYALTRMLASQGDGTPSEVARHELRNLSGFISPLKTGWAGWLVRNPWYLYVVFTTPEKAGGVREQEAMSILDGLKIRGGSDAA
jgi:hypothetical protein